MGRVSRISNAVVKVSVLMAATSAAECPRAPVRIEGPRFQCQWVHQEKPLSATQRWVLNLPEELGWSASGKPSQVRFEFFTPGQQQDIPLAADQNWNALLRRWQLPCGQSVVRFRLQVFGSRLDLKSYSLLDPRSFLSVEPCL